MTIKRFIAIVALFAATIIALSGCVSPAGSPKSFGELGAAVTVDTTAAPPAVTAEPVPDVSYSMGEQVYLDTLDAGGIAYSTNDAAIIAGNSVCEYLRSGGTGIEATDVVMSSTSYSAYEAGYIVGAAQGALCPDMIGS